MFSLGLEFSTQSVKMVVLDVEQTTIVYTGGFDYESALPQYETQGGVLPSENPAVRHTSPMMLIDALDYAFSLLKKDGVDTTRIRALKVDGMQHCTVYVDQTFENRLQKLNTHSKLVDQLGEAISRPSSPIWEDRSTQREVDYLNEALIDFGGIEKLTGNFAELRFPAAQVMKWACENPEEYSNTSSIMLLSAFMTSILSGRVAPVDTGDGWGTNFNNIDIDNPGWSPEVLQIAQSYIKEHGLPGDLKSRLGRMEHYDAIVGRVISYFSDKYGISSEAVVLAGTGDNPATLLGCGGRTVISLGSSYTVNGIVDKLAPSTTGEYNTFGYTPGRAMALSVFTNGGRVHDHFIRRYILKNNDQKPDKDSWKSYIETAGNPVLQTGEPLLLPYILDESVPVKKAGIIRQGLNDEDPTANIRALHLSQVLALKLHSQHLAVDSELFVVGGGSINSLLRQWIADAFKVRTVSIKSAAIAAPLGCAISGLAHLSGNSYESAAAFVSKDTDTVCEPINENLELVDTLLKRYQDLERSS